MYAGSALLYYSFSMIDCRIFIESNIGWDETVTVKTDFPTVPRKGDKVTLKRDLLSRLEDQAKKSLEIASRYAPDFFYGFSTGVEAHELTLKSLDDLSFADACYVKTVEFVSGAMMVNIMLARWEPDLISN
jgi:hypothetical protein